MDYRSPSKGEGQRRASREGRRKDISRKAQLVQNTVTHHSLIGTPKNYDKPYHLQEDYYLHIYMVQMGYQYITLTRVELISLSIKCYTL